MAPPASNHFEAYGFDEARDPGGEPRGAYATMFERTEAVSWATEAKRIRAELADRGVVFGGDERHAFEVDPVPRLIEAEPWEQVERGLIQRVRALNAFLDDVYGERRIVAEGVMPGRVIDEAEFYERALVGILDASMPSVRAQVAGPDLVRCADGELQVLEDNLRAPSGLAFALAARAALAPLIAASGLQPRPLEPALGALGRTLSAAAPAGIEDPRIVLLSDGPGSAAAYEHRELCRILGLLPASVGDLRRDGDRLLLVSDAGAPVDVIYRRVDDERLTLPSGRPTPLGELLIEPLRAGSLGLVNSPGSGVGDDKAVHTYVERMIDFYLGEPALLRSVPGYDLGDPEQLAAAMPRLAELVIKPRADFGGQGVMIGPLTAEQERERAVASVRAEPHRFVAQEPIALSVHPTVVRKELENRHVDLRPFVLSSGSETFVVPGGLTRFARDEGSMVVNSGRGGGAKDTWIL